MAAVPDPQTLGAIPLFQGLTLAQLAQLNAALYPATIAAGTALITLEQPGQIVYILLDGTVKVQIEQEDGSNVLLAILGPGQVLGEMSLVDSLGCSATVVTLEQSSFLCIAHDQFRAFLRAMPLLSENLMRILSSRMRLAHVQIQSLATLDINGRVARQLLALAREYGQATPDGQTIIPLRLTQSDLADLVGSSRVRVNQVLRTCMQRHCITIDRNNHITIRSLAALARCGQRIGHPRDDASCTALHPDPPAANGEVLSG